MSELDPSTEEKIKEAARKVFTKKGYAATRTRDIAEEAGINLSLLNYYFRSKEKLFHQVIMEKVQQIFGVLFPILSNESLSLDEKIDLIVENYINLLIENPNLPIFVFSELKNHPQLFEGKINANLVKDSSFIKQLRERRPDINPAQFMVSIFGMTVFPFMAKPILSAVHMATEDDFEALMIQRKVLVPKWIKAILESE
ncbi:TetR/AcrR family transcriptional regulator [Flavobacterium amniphilum]|uniref:TetR/AcrR family transcriptional regulator n=1 Tax=Flavobacterium amniphilum TaxID=1834035 RepID=UPI00202A20B0|nr:TetR/AcrR family transcriptional regulator [Flavobacterium amniphilum]MCL9805887.1 TetR/AcrR family transcriptional regulator [Flavobacterium amniphilum]